MKSPVDSSESNHSPTAGTSDDPDLRVFPPDADRAATASAFENAVTRFVPGVLQDRLPALIETAGAKPCFALWTIGAAITCKVLAIDKRSWPDLLKRVFLLLGLKLMQLNNFFFERVFTLRGLSLRLRQSRYLTLQAKRERLQAQQMVIDVDQRRVDVVVDFGSQSRAKQLYSRLRRLIGGR